jgi:hypothetical protein
MQVHDFTLVLSGIPGLTDAVCDALFEAGCDDAVQSAIAAVEGAGIGARVVRVEPDGLVKS